MCAASRRAASRRHRRGSLGSLARLVCLDEGELQGGDFGGGFIEFLLRCTYVLYCLVALRLRHEPLRQRPFKPAGEAVSALLESALCLAQRHDTAVASIGVRQPTAPTAQCLGQRCLRVRVRHAAWCLAARRLGGRCLASVAPLSAAAVVVATPGGDQRRWRGERMGARRAWGRRLGGGRGGGGRRRRLMKLHGDMLERRGGRNKRGGRGGRDGGGRRGAERHGGRG